VAQPVIRAAYTVYDLEVPERAATSGVPTESAEAARTPA
jgi:hypothetical protein